MNAFATLILAAGLGKRMNSDLPKVLTKTTEKSLISHVLSTVEELKPQKNIIITGYKRELVESEVREHFPHLPGLEFAFQDQQLGTGHAVKCALPLLGDFQGQVAILYGDVPLITPKTLQHLLSLHAQEEATITVASFIPENPDGYGRIVRDAKNHVQQIVETKDCSQEQRLIGEVNSGIYIVDSAFLKPSVERLENNNQQKEYYLTDIVAQAVQEGQRVSAFIVPDPAELMGINTPWELSTINKALRLRKVQSWAQNGIIFEDPDTVYLEGSPQIERGARIGPNVHLRGNTRIEKDVRIEGNAYLVDTIVSEGALVKFGVRSESSRIGKNASVGPFAHLRPGTVLEESVKVGNFVETKNAHLGPHTAASHLTYLGDCEIGTHTNVGAGVITCNYDGVKKSRTTIGNHVFVGSDSVLIAPVTIEDHAFIGAGSVITKNVESKSLVLTRAPLVVKKDYVEPKKE